MKKTAAFIVRFRKVFLVLFLLFTVYCVTLMPKVNINYNLVDYIPEGETSRGIEVMQEEFGSIDQLRVYVKNVTVEQAQAIADKIKGIEGVQYVSFTGKSADYKDNCAVIGVITGHETLSSSEIMESVEKALGKEEESYILGTTVTTKNLRNAISEQIPVIMVIAAVIIFAILFLTSDSYFEPVLFAVVIGISIVINLGTNAWLSGVSFITHAICAIMQLAMAMDYAIMLLHRFREEEKNTPDVKEAMTNAVAQSISTISGSSLTTIAGLAAIMLMQFRLGYDLGLVLIKGILCSMLTVFLFMPGLILALNGVFKKGTHKKFIRNSRYLNSFIIKSRKVLPFILIAVIIAGAAGATQLEYNYEISTLGASCNPDYASVAAEVDEKFGKTNNFVLLLPVGYEEKEKEVCEFIESMSDDGYAVTSVTGMGATPIYYSMTAEELSVETGLSRRLTKLIYNYFGYDEYESVPVTELLTLLYEHRDDAGLNLAKSVIEEYYTLWKDGEKLLVGENYTRVLIVFDMDLDDVKAFDAVEVMRERIGKIYNEFYLFGDTVNMYDIRATFGSDMLLTNLVTIGAIFLILLVIFRRVSVSVLLIAVIQGAVQINSALTVLSGNTMFFCCKMFVDCILMGATVDYAILLTSRFTEARKEGKSIEQALRFGMDATLLTVLTSGLILVLAGFIIGFVSTISVISEIGILVGRGSLISMLLIIFLLPECLIFFESVKEKHAMKKQLAENGGPEGKTSSMVTNEGAFREMRVGMEENGENKKEKDSVKQQRSPETDGETFRTEGLPDEDTAKENSREGSIKEEGSGEGEKGADKGNEDGDISDEGGTKEGSEGKRNISG